MTVTWRVTWWVIWWVTWWIKSRQANYILYIESSHWADPGGIRIIHNNTLCVLYYSGRCCINWATEGSWAGWVRTWHYDYRMYIGTQEEAVHIPYPATHRKRLPKEERGLTIHWMRGFYRKLFGVNVIDYSIVGKEHCISRGHQNASTELCRECLFACSAVEWRLTVHVHVQYMCTCLNYREVCQSRDMG